MLENPVESAPHITKIASEMMPSDYQIIELIGQGGFAKVYKARQKKTDQLVAVKVIQLEQDGQQCHQRLLERFERETQLCAKLHHPNIVRLLDKGCIKEDSVYAVFEYIPGVTLKDYLIESGPLSAIETADLMGQVLDALSCAHTNGIVHRDLKPQNIMVSTTGVRCQVHILDFGIAAFTPEARQSDYKNLTMTRETVGTPTYSAPEQLRGEPPTCKTDIYAWGLLFLECLTCCPAVSGTSIASVFAKQLSPSNVPLPSFVAGHAVADLLRRVLNKNVHERAGDAAEIFRQLKGLNFSNMVGAVEAFELNQPERRYLDVTETADITQIGNTTMVNTGAQQCKQITVLCLTLSIRNLTETCLDMELVDAIHRDQKAQCIDIALRYSGFLAGQVGDTLLFYFGYPTVSDSDSRLCARTALDITGIVHKRNLLLRELHGFETYACMGIHSGNVNIHSDSIPEGQHPNEAMTLARAALANQVLCSDTSRKLLENYIEFKEVSVISPSLEYRQQPIFSLVGERQVEAIGFLRGTRSHNAFVGRDQSLQKLLDTLPKTKNDPPRKNLVHIHGEAGIGKSRLIFEFRDHAKHYDHIVAQCLPENKYSALFPILNIVRYQYSLNTLSSLEGFDRLKKALENSAVNRGDECALIILCSWLGLPLPEDMGVPQLSPHSQKTILFSTLAHLLTCQREEDQRPLLLIVEDLHWADPTTIEFIQAFSTQCRDSNQLHVLVSTSRETLPNTLLKPQAEEIKIDRLSVESTKAFMHYLFEGQSLSAEVEETILNRTDGIPLFVEELINMLKQKELLRTINGCVEFSDPSCLDQIPNTLQESLQQKLDSLIYAKETAQLSATIGREFSYKLLAEVSEIDEGQLQNNLNELIQRDLIILQRKVDGDHYLYKHALVRDAAYHSISPQIRLHYHRTIAEQLQNHSQPSLSVIALHYERAEEIALAVDAWKAQGDAYVKNGLNLEATESYKRALSLISELDKTNELMYTEIAICNAIAMCMAATVGYAHASIRPYHDRALHLCGLLGNPRELFAIFWGIAITAVVQADHTEALKVIRKLHDISEEHQDREFIIAAGTLQGGVEWAMGRLNIACESYEKVIKIYQYDRDHQLFLHYPFEPGITNLAVHSSILWLIGRPQEAQEKMDEALELCERENVHHVQAHVYARYGYYCVIKKDIKGTKYYAKKCYELSQKYGFDMWQANSEILLGWVKCHLKEFDSGLSMLERASKVYFETGAIGHGSWLLSLKSEALYLAEQYDNALSVIDEAIDLAIDREDTFYLPESYRIKHMILDKLGKESNYLEKAKLLADKQGARGYIEYVLEKHEDFLAPIAWN